MEKIQRALEKARREREATTLRRSTTGKGAPPCEGADRRTFPGVRATRVQPVPPEVLHAQRVVSGLNGIEATEAFRMLRAQVMQRLESANASTLAITSAGADEGKTLVAANLAVSLSRLADRRVLLVDVDLRRPAMHSVFGLSPTKGLAHHLLQNAPLADCLISPGLDGLVLLPCGTGGEMSSELLSSPAMARLVEELKDRYSDRIVLYDLPPLLLTDDAFMFLKHVDACLLVVEQGSTRREEIERCLELLQEFNVIGTVLNKARSPQGGYGYGYGY